MRPLLVVLALLGLLAAGCGSEGPGGGVNVAAADIDRILEAEDAINTRCGLIAAQEGSDLPLGDAVDELVALLRENPEGVVALGVSNRQRNVTQIVRDAAERLETCRRPDPAAAQRLRQALERYGAET